jgi:formylmethanofuran dehydrogenase subunit E
MVSQNVAAVLSQTNQKVPVISFIGNSGCGKTTLIEKVVRELKQFGYKVAVVKHTPHGFDIDRPQKDSGRLTLAGSDIVVLSSPERVSLVERVDAELTLTQIKALVGDKVDIMLVEGYKNGRCAKVIVLDSEGGEPGFAGEGEILATVSPRWSSSDGLRFEDDDVANITSLLLAQVSGTLPGEFGDVAQVADLVPERVESQVDRFGELLAESAALHGHICPGQVLGVRMAQRGCRELGIVNPREERKRMVVYVEIDRCATDAIQVVTGCKLGKRTLKYVDYGKLAATFVDLHTGRAVRVVAREDAREKATLWHRPGWTKHEAEAVAYKAMPDEALFEVENVVVQIPLGDMPGPPRRRVICDECGEGVNDCREVMVAGRVLCRSCAYGGYYRTEEKGG